MHRPHKLTATVLLVLAAFFPAASAQSPAQTAPRLDMDQFFTGWKQLERYTPRAERACLSDAVLLYAPGDKHDSLQMVSSCEIKDGNWNFWNRRGTIDSNGDGEFKIITFWPFRMRYRVFAIAPDYTWALVGSSNHHFLWVLARTPTLPPDVLAGIEAKAAAAGFNIAKLQKVPQAN